MVVESSLSRRRDFDFTAWVAAAAASWRYVRNLWIDEPSDRSEKWNLHLWHHGDTFQHVLFHDFLLIVNSTFLSSLHLTQFMNISYLSNSGEVFLS